MNARAWVMILVGVAAAGVRADIPRIDAVVFGTLTVDGQPVAAGDGYMVVMRIDGFEDPVAVCRIGDNPAAGGHYSLHVPMAYASDGATASAKTPAAGVTAEVWVKGPDGTEVRAAEVEVPRSGEVRQVDLSLPVEDVVAGQQLSDTGANGCGAGTCGAVGVVCPLLTMCGLIQMRARRRR